jgi:predicted RNase H-like HicB family nuclease
MLLEDGRRNSCERQGDTLDEVYLNLTEAVACYLDL